MQIIRELKYFDEKNFPQYGSDDDFCLRALEKGYPVYISWDAKVFRSMNTTSTGVAFKKASLLIFLKSFF